MSDTSRTSTHRWWLDEADHAGREHLDPGFVAGYDAKQRFDPAADVGLLVERGLGPGRRLLDLGAGTGTLTVAAAATGAEIVAIDVSPAMAAVLEERCDGVPNVRVERAGVLTFEPADRFDIVYCRNVLHQLPDFWKVMALRRIATWLVPGGTLVLRDLVYDVEPDDVEDTFRTWFDGAVDEPSTGYTADDFAEHVRTEHSTFTWLFGPMLERTGFTIVDRDVTKGVYAGYTCRLDAG